MHWAWVQPYKDAQRCHVLKEIKNGVAFTFCGQRYFTFVKAAPHTDKAFGVKCTRCITRMERLYLLATGEGIPEYVKKRLLAPDDFELDTKSNTYGDSNLGVVYTKDEIGRLLS